PARFLMEASPLAKLLQLAAITKADFVLEVGCGTGYTSELLSIIAGSVIALECDETLDTEAKAQLEGYAKVEVVTGSLEKGYAAGAP
ncbi:protein-L-isoaspartate O-methyltransferase, partial [Rhizobium ruizarguesonis]